MRSESACRRAGAHRKRCLPEGASATEAPVRRGERSAPPPGKASFVATLVRMTKHERLFRDFSAKAETTTEDQNCLDGRAGPDTDGHGADSSQNVGRSRAYP